MYITVRMSNGKKITGQTDNLVFFTTSIPDSRAIVKDKLTINLDQVLYIRPARDEEIEHARIHGW